MKKSLRYLLLAALVASFAACCPDEPVDPDTTTRTVLVYMVGTSNLRGHLEKNIADMVTGMAGQSGNLIVYYDPDNDVPRLWKIDPLAGKLLLETYGEENSASKAVLQRVVNRVLTDPDYKADSYGIIFSGHATGWIPPPAAGGSGAMKKFRAPLLDENPDGPYVTRSFGIDIDNGARQEMAVTDLAAALPGNRFFDFMLFDDCFMSGMEALYDLRKSAKYIIASPAEVMGPGYPFTQTVPIMFGAGEMTPALLSRMAQTFMDFYKSYTVPSGLMTVTDTEKLEALTFSVWEILQYESLADRLTPLNLSDIQAFEKQPSHIFFDLDSYMQALVGADHALYANFRSALENAVVYCGYTPRGYSNYGGTGYYSVNSCCGITSFITQSRPDYTEDYRQTTYMTDYDAWANR